LLLLYRKFHYDISMYICIISQLGSSPSLFFPFYLSLLIVISTGLKIHSCIESISTIFTFTSFFWGGRIFIYAQMIAATLNSPVFSVCLVRVFPRIDLANLVGNQGQYCPM
jgi:hypothetical protein